MDEFYLILIKVTLFILGMMGLLVLMKRYGLRIKENFEKREGREIRKVDSLPIGFRRHLILLEVMDRIIVIGVSEKEITPVALWKKED